MGMKNRLFIHKINPTFLTLTVSGIHHSLSPWIPGFVRFLPEIGSVRWAQQKHNTSHIDNAIHNAYKHQFHPIEVDYHSSSQAV